MGTLRQAGIQPGAEVRAESRGFGVRLTVDGLPGSNGRRGIHPLLCPALTRREEFRSESDDVNWRKYLAEFHRDRAGIAEPSCPALAGDHSPTAGWLARLSDGDNRSRSACGSGPMSRELAQPGVRLSVSICLNIARFGARTGPGPWDRADALQLPFKTKASTSSPAR